MLGISPPERMNVGEAARARSVDTMGPVPEARFSRPVWLCRQNRDGWEGKLPHPPRLGALLELVLRCDRDGSLGHWLGQKGQSRRRGRFAFNPDDAPRPAFRAWTLLE